MDEFLKDLDSAQRIGHAACQATAERIEIGLSREDLTQILHEETLSRGATLEDPPLVLIGEQTTGGPLSRVIRSNGLRYGEVVTLALRPVVGRAIGDFADTLVFSDHGRYWQFRRMAFRIFRTFVQRLDAARSERDVIRLADDCATSRGFSLHHPISGTITHPLDAISPQAERQRQRVELLQNRWRRLFPQNERPLVGTWCLEPRFLVSDVGYFFKVAIHWDEAGTLTRLGHPLADNVPIGPWLA